MLTATVKYDKRIKNPTTFVNLIAWQLKEAHRRECQHMPFVDMRSWKAGKSGASGIKWSY